MVHELVHEPHCQQRPTFSPPGYEATIWWVPAVRSERLIVQLPETSAQVPSGTEPSLSATEPVAAVGLTLIVKTTVAPYEAAPADVTETVVSAGATLWAIEAELLTMYRDPSLDTKPKLLEERGGAFYSAAALDLADRLQTPVFVMTDLDIGMNTRLCRPMQWDDSKVYDRGKVMTAADLDSGKRFGRYLDVDGDGIAYRTLPGTHPSKGAFFTRGSGHNLNAVYTEDSAEYKAVLDRIALKMRTAANAVPDLDQAIRAWEARQDVIDYLNYKNSWGFGIRVRRPDLFLFRFDVGIHGLSGAAFNLSVNTPY